MLNVIIFLVIMFALIHMECAPKVEPYTRYVKARGNTSQWANGYYRGMDPDTSRWYDDWDRLLSTHRFPPGSSDRRGAPQIVAHSSVWRGAYETPGALMVAQTQPSRQEYVVTGRLNSDQCFDGTVRAKMIKCHAKNGVYDRERDVCNIYA